MRGVWKKRGAISKMRDALQQNAVKSLMVKQDAQQRKNATLKMVSVWITLILQFVSVRQESSAILQMAFRVTVSGMR
jgi:hypothetical protein